MEAPPILKLMSEQAKARCEEILARAEANASAIIDAGKQRAQERLDAGLSTVDRELEALAKRSRERAEAEAYMIEFTTRDTIADELLAQVDRDLREAAAGKDFAATLEALLGELAQDIKQGMVVLAPKAHVDHVKAWLKANGHDGVEVQDDPSLKDGVAVQDAARTFRVTNTLSTRFRMRQDQLRRESLERLFGREKH